MAVHGHYYFRTNCELSDKLYNNIERKYLSLKNKPYANQISL